MLLAMGFPTSFANLLYECISTSSFSMLIEGTLFDFIESSSGLRQVDPLSPYLFAIVMEFLSINLHLEYIKGNLSLIHNINPIITHLLYVDDILIMAKANISSADCIMHTFHNLKVFTGLDINENKSIVYFSKESKNKKQIADFLKINTGNSPTTYLGIPLSNNILKTRYFGCLIDKINK